MEAKKYLALKEKEMEQAKQTIQSFVEKKNKYIRFPKQRPITDLKNMINSSAELYGDRIAFMQKFEKNAPFTKITFKEALDDINGLGTSLIDIGLKNKRIGVCGDNCYQWSISYLSIVCGTGVVVPLDKELSVNELEQLIQISGLTAVLCSKKLEPKFQEIKANKQTKLKTIIVFDKPRSSQDSLSQKTLINAGKRLVAKGDKRFVDAQIMRDKMAVLLFTSGTTGISKGVMLSHKNLAEDLMAAPTVFDCTEKDVFFSVLPLHHTYECTCGMLMPFYKGCCVGYCQGLKYIQKELAEVRPTIFLLVPLILESLYKKIQKNIQAQGKEKAIKRAIKMNKMSRKIGINLSKTFFSAIHDIFGGRIKCLIVGGAAINPAILQFFRDIGINALQGYGLTECSPMAALNPDLAPKDTSCGRVLTGFEAKIADAGEDGVGEICIKGPHIMLGYYENEEATKDAIVDGWYYTGDLGYMDDEGYIFITGRKKNVIITKNGKNVFPEEIEYYLSQVPIVAESMVWADEAKQGEDVTIVASIFPNVEEIKSQLGHEPSKDEIEQLLWDEIDKINADIPFFKRVKKLKVRDKDFVKNSSKKIKRYVKENKE